MNSQRSLKASILALLPPELASELKDSIDSIIQGQFEQMNLVSRQDFEVQQKVLVKTRAKLEALEKQVAALEQRE